VPANSSYREVEDLRPGIRAAATDNPEVELMSLVLLEPADLARQDVAMTVLPNHVSVAKALLYDEADVGFFLAATYDDLSPDVSSQLRVLVRSEIFVITHLFLIHPRLAAFADTFRRCLMVMDTDAKGLAALDDVGIDRWDPVEQEEVEFMIDLMHALQE
jgi:phosphonate transport system substrate-binding protein